MSDRLRVTMYEGLDTTLVRGLPAEVLHRAGPRHPWSGEHHAWAVPTPLVGDLRVMLEREGIGYRSPTGPIPPWHPPVVPMTQDEAEAATAELIGLYGRVETAVIRMTHVATEIAKRRGWAALRFDSFEAYCAARLPFTLPKDVRREVVIQAISEGMSTRAAAAIARTSLTTARRDAETAEPQSLSGAPNGAPVRVGADGKTYPASRPASPPVDWQDDAAGSPAPRGVVQGRVLAPSVPQWEPTPARPDLACLDAALNLLWHHTDSVPNETLVMLYRASRNACWGRELVGVEETL